MKLRGPKALGNRPRKAMVCPAKRPDRRRGVYIIQHCLMKKLVTALLLVTACALAQGPSAVAIRNARIVTVSGPVIAKGTVVVRNGLIEAVGENVTIPPEALVVDGEGMTVYPGLIDSLSTVGIPGAAPAATAATGRGGGRTQAAPTTAAPAATAATQARSN